MSEELNTTTYERKTRAAEQEILLPAHTGETAKIETVAERETKTTEALKTAHNEAVTINPLERMQAAETAAAEPTRQHIDSELKSITLKRELKHLQRKESFPQRTLSKVIHQPVVRVVSEAAGKTVSRPSGLLGGGIVALVGTSAYLYLAKHIGFEYNSGVFLALFVGGFALGLILELLVHLTTASRHKADA